MERPETKLDAWVGGWLLAFAIASIRRGDWRWAVVMVLVGGYYTARAFFYARKESSGPEA